MKKQDLNQDNDFFYAKQVDESVLLTFKKKVLLPFAYLTNKKALFDYLDFVSKDNNIKVVIVTVEPGRSPREEYYEFYNLFVQAKIDKGALMRMYRAYDQFIVKIVKSNKFFISVGHGEMISQDFYVDLACDYSIVADNTVIHKPYLKLGLVPKGGGAYFLKRKLGHSRAYEILLSPKDITANEALKLGIVDKVAPNDVLEYTALKTAKQFAQAPATSLSGTKKLLNYSWKDLEEYLKAENFELWDIISKSSLFKSAAGRNSPRERYLRVG